MRRPKFKNSILRVILIVASVFLFSEFTCGAANIFTIDDYNDWNPNTNSLLYNQSFDDSTQSGNPATLLLEEEYLHRYLVLKENKAKKITYDVTNVGSWARYSTKVWNGTTPLNVSSLGYLSFRVKRELRTEGNNQVYTACYFKIRYGDNYPSSVETPLLYTANYFLETDEWQLVNIPLGAFTGLDLTKVQEIIFYFANDPSLPIPPLPAKQGVLYIDNLQFSKGYGKQESTGPVRIDRRTKKLFVDGQPFNIKGVAYQPTPIGGWGYEPGVYDRDFPLLVEMGCNTIRTWGPPPFELMDKASQYGLKVIAGFWMDTDSAVNYGDSSYREDVKQSFTGFVRFYKDFNNTFPPDKQPLLIWALGNENNYKNYSIKNFYSLCNELAQIAFVEETKNAPSGSFPYHPVMIVNGDLYNVGEEEMGGGDLQLNYIDAWGTNAYHRDYNMVNWTARLYDWTEATADPRDRGIDWFELYKEKSFKPVVITEYGADAFRTLGVSPIIVGDVDEVMQADFVRESTLDIMNASDVCLGGTLMAYSDEWWKAGDPYNQDAGPAIWWGENQPDEYVNEEYWGIMRVIDTPSYLDIVEPRLVYYVLQELYLHYVPPDITGNVSVSEDASGYPGDAGIPVSVTISGIGAKEIEYVQFTLKYDQNSLVATGVENGPLTAGWLTDYNLSVPGEATVIFYPDFPGVIIEPLGGELARILFNVKADAQPALLNLQLTGVLLNNEPPAIIEDGLFQILEEPLPTTYTLTVTNGTGSGMYNENAVVDIESNAPAIGYHFSRWIINSGTSTIADVNASSTTITMLSDATITAEYAINTYTLAITAINGSVTKAPDLANYNHGQSVRLTAISTDGYQFKDWSGSITGSQNPIDVIMNSNKSITANFEELPPAAYLLTISTTEGGTTEPLPGIYTHDADSPVSIQATAGANYTFTGWQGDVPAGHELDNPLELTINSSKSITANFEAEVIIHTLIISSTKGGHTIPQEGTYIYSADDPVSIEAIPDDNYTFTEWTGEGVPLGDENTNPLPLIMDSNKTITANFEELPPVTYTLTVNNGTGSGVYNEDAIVNIEANAPAIGYHFSRWIINSGTSTIANVNSPSTTITMLSDTEITAEFTKNIYTLYIITSEQSGSVSIEPDQTEYTHSTIVTLTASTTDPNYKFTGWAGGDVPSGRETDNPLMLTMDSDKFITANFEVVTYTLTISTTAGGHITDGNTTLVPGNYTYNAGASVTLRAVADSSYTFTGWTGTLGSRGPVMDNPLTLTMDSDRSVTANFKLVTYNLAISSTAGGYTIPGAGTYSYNSGTTASVRAIAQTGYGYQSGYGNQSGYGSQTNYVFTGWQGDVPQGHEKDNPLTLVMDSNKSIKANFEPPPTYTLTIAISGHGMVVKSPNQASYTDGTKVTLTASPSRGYVFVKWQGDLTGSVNSAIITMNSNKNVTAVFLSSSHPWNFNPNAYKNFPYYLPIYGTAMINGQRLYIGDWVGVFDKDGNCYGVGQYQFDPSRSKYYYALSAYPESGEDGLTGFTEGEPMLFKFYSPSRGGIIDASPSPFTIYRYPDVKNGDINPLEINLTDGHTLIVNNGSGSGVYNHGAVANIQADTPLLGSRFDHWNIDAGTSTIANANGSSTEVTVLSHTVVTAVFTAALQTQTVVLDKGWNFISFYVNPSDPSIEEIFSSILEKVEYVRDHMHWWSPATGGSLTEISPYHSYYIKTNEECVLTVTGIPVQLPYALILEKGWMSISYPYEVSASAIGRTEDPSVYNGFFKDIMSNIVWIKGKDGWCAPDVGELELKRGEGIFIKLKNSGALNFPLR